MADLWRIPAPRVLRVPVSYARRTAKFRKNGLKSLWELKITATISEG